MDDITILQAEVLKTLASPKRLEILHALAQGPLEVGRLAEAMGMSQPNASQHLAVLRAAGVVEAERDGREVRYRLVDPDVIGRLRPDARRAPPAPDPPRRPIAAGQRPAARVSLPAASR